MGVATCHLSGNRRMVARGTAAAPTHRCESKWLLGTMKRQRWWRWRVLWPPSDVQVMMMMMTMKIMLMVMMIRMVSIDGRLTHERSSIKQSLP